MSVAASAWTVGDTWPSRPSGIIVPPRRKRDRPIAIDFFCGAGGFSLGLMQAGFDVIAGIDNWPDAMLTYLVNLGAYPVDLVFLTDQDRDAAETAIAKQMGLAGKGSKAKDGKLVKSVWVSGSNRAKVMPGREGVKHFFLGDVRLLTGQAILDRIGCQPGEVDLVVGGPPCQGFSTAGKQNVMDPRNSLVFEWARLVLEIQPKTICMENVPGILKMVTPEGIPVVDALCRVLADGGFGAVDGLKRSLLATAGVGGAVRGRRGDGTKGAKKSAAKPDRDLVGAPLQGRMF